MAASGRTQPIPTYCLEHAFRVSEALKHVVILSGGAGTMHYKQNVFDPWVTKVGKVTAGTDFVNFGVWESPEDMVRYAEQRVELTEEDRRDMRSLFKVLGGRFQTLSSVLEIMIVKDLSLRKAAEYVILGLTTKGGRRMLRQTCYDAVTQLAHTVAGGNLLKELEMAVVQYFVTGRPYVLRGKHTTCVKLVEAGLGRVEETDEEELCVHVDEYMVLAAAKNFFEDEHVATGKLRTSFLPSKWLSRVSKDVTSGLVQGLCLQTFSAVWFERMWERFDGRMSDMPMFKPLLEASGCPQAFVELAGMKGKMVEGWIEGFVSGYDRDVFLTDLERGSPLCTSWISNDNTEVVRGIGYEYMKGDGQKEMYIAHVVEQHKSVKDPEFLPRVDHLLSDVQLRVVVMPLELKREESSSHFWEAHGGKTMGFVILDARNASELFEDQSVLDFLKMKNGPSALQDLARKI